MYQEKNVLICDDHPMIALGLKLELEVFFNIKKIDIVDSCAGILSILNRNKNKYTHIVLDLLFEDGNAQEIILNMQILSPQSSILIYSMQPKSVYSKLKSKYGIYDYLQKNARETETKSVLDNFLNNKSTLESKVVNTKNPFSSLSVRELEVMHFLLNGISTKEIAENLNLKLNTVSTFKNRIFEKTKVKNIKELVDLATIYNIYC